MRVKVTVALKVSKGEDPKFYWVEAETSYDPSEVMLKNNSQVRFAPATGDAANHKLEFFLERVESAEAMECPVKQYFELGDLKSTGPDCAVEINVYHGNLRVGGGIPKLANATQVDKPADWSGKKLG